MNILVIEDEKHNADRLIRLLEDSTEDARVHGPLASVAETRDFFRKAPAIDLILADIRLTDGLSFDGLQDIPDNVPVIFTTAYDEYALKAFNYNGIAYLLKPIEKEELIEAIEKSRRMFTTPPATREIADIYRLLQNQAEVYRQRFLIADHDGYITVPVSEVSYICADSGMARLFMKDKKQYTIEMSLDDIDSQLNPMQFFRATRQQIVNITSVRRVSNLFNRRIKIIVSEYPDIEVVVGREKVVRLKQWLDR